MYKYYLFSNIRCVLQMGKCKRINLTELSDNTVFVRKSYYDETGEEPSEITHTNGSYETLSQIILI